MNILMLAPLPPPSGGIASWTIRYKAYCEENSIPLRIVNIALQGNRATKEAMRRNFAVEIKRTISILKSLKKEIRKDKPDIVHLNTSCSKFGIIRDALCTYILHGRIPLILHCRCNVEDRLHNKVMLSMFRYMVKKAQKVIVLNSFSKEFVDDIEHGKAIFVPNFVDEKILHKDHLINEKLRNVVYVGHVDKSKGITHIVEAAKKLHEMKFILVGAIREDISYLDIPSNVSLVGRVSVDEIQDYLKKADAFVFPSLSEGFSNALLEAMAAGVPIIASNVGANSEMIENHGGIVLKDNTGDELYKTILTIQDPSIRKEMSEWNINKVRNAYTIKKVMQEYFNIYHQAREV